MKYTINSIYNEHQVYYFRNPDSIHRNGFIFIFKIKKKNQKFSKLSILPPQTKINKKAVPQVVIQPLHINQQNTRTYRIHNGAINPILTRPAL